MSENLKNNKKLTTIEKFNSRKFFVIFICLLISVFLWLIININKVSKTSINLKYKFTNLSQEYSIENQKNELSFNISGIGLNLLQHLVKYQPVAVEIDFEKVSKFPLNDTSSTICVLTKDLATHFNYFFSNDIKIESISPDTLKFYHFNSKKSVKLPVELNVKYSINKKIMLSGKPQFVENYDSVIVEGSEDFLNHIRKIKTKPIDLGEISDDQIFNVELETNPELNYSFSTVNFYFPIEKFTEENIEVNIETKNFPKNANITLIPDKINVSYKVPLSLHKNINQNNFKAVVDYNKRKSGNKIFVEILSKNNNIEISNNFSQYVKFILESKK
jgi:YbbR domain-containing protein